MAEDDDAARRQREINMFAAMAAGDTFRDFRPAERKPEDGSNVESSSHTWFAASHSTENSGTFAVSSSPNAHGAAAIANLQAAAAALTAGNVSPMPEPPPPLKRPVFSTFNRPPTKPMPMYAERVLMPRPLFYGPILPPRVLEETREAVAAALKDLNLGENETPLLSALPPQIRNLVGAIDAFGFGVSAFPPKDGEKQEEPWRGSAYVSTYQPVWGDVARADREERYKRSYQAAAVAAALASGETTGEQASCATTAGQATSGEPKDIGATPTVSNKLVDRDMFSQWARGEDDGIKTDANGSIERMASFKASNSGVSTKRGSKSDQKSFARRTREGTQMDPSTSTSVGSTFNSNEKDGKASTPVLAPASDQVPFSDWVRGFNHSPTPPPPEAKSKLGESDVKADKDLFLKWARGDVDAFEDASSLDSVNMSSNSGKQKESSDVDQPEADQNLQLAQSQQDSQPLVHHRPKDQSKIPDSAAVSRMSDKELFAQWAQSNTDDSPVPSRVASLSSSASEKRDATSSLDKSVESKSSSATNTMSDKNVFSPWSRGNMRNLPNSSSSTTKDDRSSAKRGDSRSNSDNELFSQWLQAEKRSSLKSSPPGSINLSEDTVDREDFLDGTRNTPSPAPDKALFAQWAQKDMGNSFRESSRPSGQPFHTFRPVEPTFDEESDDDSVVGSELKKKVGMNEHLNAALASLANEASTSGGVPSGAGAESLTAEEANSILSQIGVTTLGGRPLSNFELTNGCVPLYGCDDTPLPVEADLGIFQTKDDQHRSMQLRQSQEIIGKHTVPNIFGVIACPNPALGPDDNRSWNSRTVPVHKEAAGSGAVGGQISGPEIFPLPVYPSRKPRRNPFSQPTTAGVGDASVGTDSLNSTSLSGLPPTPSSRRGPGPSQRVTSKAFKWRDTSSTSILKQGPNSSPRFDASARFGWWNIEDQILSSVNGTGANNLIRHDSCSEQSPVLQLTPSEHSSDTLYVQTGLSPTPQLLRESNLPLSNLHSATSIAGVLPFLSDRSPSFRYLQIDTQAVGFPDLEGEIEPLFCSVSIYHVQTVASGLNHPKTAPLPDLLRCGRITEVLNFDIVSDPEVETRCRSSLWPYDSATGPIRRTQGSRCGVFPLPSNLNISNLYATIIVHRVLSDDADLDEAYVKPSKSASSDQKGTLPRSGTIDIRHLRKKAEQAAMLRGQFLMPFAFGVAPLLQIFGTDVPTVPTSRAVQIPLFGLSPGQGDRPIIDQIMVMLYPRADHHSVGILGPAPLTNGGIAMLVMRNFGYLGLHSVVSSKSSLARDRLVHFSGELQLRRKDPTSEETSRAVLTEGKNYIAPPWHDQFLAEPTENGGRNEVQLKERVSDSKGQPRMGQKSVRDANTNDRDESLDDVSRSKLYSQELAPVPLQLTPSAVRSLPTPPRVRGQRSVQPTGSGGGDVEPFFHTTFCNELLCHPRLLHGCFQRMLTIKVELRELQWIEEHQGYLAHLPSCGPSIHNPRRGPFLVQETFTSCTLDSANPRFYDEFKVKLPLVLLPRSAGKGIAPRSYVLLFSVYKIDLKPKKKSPDSGSTNKRGISLGMRFSARRGSRSAESNGETGGGDESRSNIERLACGFLPVAEAACLIHDGLHDVKLNYTPRLLSQEVLKGSPHRGELLLCRIPDKSNAEGPSIHKSIAHGGSLQSTADGKLVESADDVSGRQMADTDDILDGSTFGSEWTGSDAGTDVDSISGVKVERSMALQVRIVVHSSVHSQNGILNEFLRRMPDPPVPLPPLTRFPFSPWKLGRSDLLKHICGMTTATDDRPQEGTKELLNLTVDISKNSMCPPAEVSRHFLRVFPQLLRTIVSGSGRPSLLWTNPAAIIPLRLHSFATLLQMLNTVNSFMVKNGVTQLDGKSRWTLTSLARVLAMAFDEEKLFEQPSGEQMGEVFDWDEWLSNARTDHVEIDSVTSSVSDSLTGIARGNDAGHSIPSSSGWLKPIGVKKIDDIVISREFERHESLDAFLSGFASMPDNSADGESLRQRSMTLQSPLVMSNMSSEGLAPLPLMGSSPKEMKADETAEIKIDSKSDFQSALWAASAAATDPSIPMSGDAVSPAVQNMIRAYSSLGNISGRRKWMTLPSSALATIREDTDDTDAHGSGNRKSIARYGESAFSRDTVDTELVLHPPAPPGSVKQMRVPRLKKAASTENTSQTNENAATSPSTPEISSVDEQMERAGTAFLDVVGKNLGYGIGSSKHMGGEEQRVGQPHHRKTRSRCSIDWTLPEIDLRIDDQPLTEQAPPIEIAVSAVPIPAVDDKLETQTQDAAPKPQQSAEGSFQGQKLSMSSLAEEEKNTLPLPNYVDRLVKLGKSDGFGRWCPFTYEVIIFQWVALLLEQRRVGEKSNENSSYIRNLATAGSKDYQTASTSRTDRDLVDASLRAKGVTIACAPVLFEIIKKSVGWRVDYLFRRAEQVEGISLDRFPPLVRLDDTLLSQLELLVSIVTDACIDSRNFDSYEFKRTSIEVNDSIVRFLRDMFAFFETKSVHRLILVYLSRFVVREGKRWQDRDSKIGLRCSWEICKLRLNAITMLVRFPDFLRVNSPQMNNWGNWPLNAPAHLSRDFFSNALREFQALAIPGFAATEGPIHKSGVKFSSLKPHWLVELVTDICLSGTDHAEQSIQHRAASLLHELFWAHSQEAKANGTSSIVASMYVPFVVKILGHINYLSNLPAKSQLRKDLLPCVVFVMQCAPLGLMRALWRSLCSQSEGKGFEKRFGGVNELTNGGIRDDLTSVDISVAYDDKNEPDVFDMFSLLNLGLGTFEYEGCDKHLEAENISESNDQLAIWKKEFLLATEQGVVYDSGHKNVCSPSSEVTGSDNPKQYSSTNSRRWHAHDGAIVIIDTSRHIVREMTVMVRQPAGGISSRGVVKQEVKNEDEGLGNVSDIRTNAKLQHELTYSLADTVVFVRAATSVYLHALSLRQSDIVIVKTLIASIEIVKIFGIKVFLQAVGETLQHWMRIVSLQCGARRAEVRVQALEFLALVLRLTWDSYGSFFRVRVPLLAVQSEVMERIVATATMRHYREQRRMGSEIQSLSNDSAEASLAPLWRTLDRLHHQSASQNVAFRSALVRLAENMKKLYRGYLAAHALAILNRARSAPSPNSSINPDGVNHEDDDKNELSAYLQSRRIIVHRLVTASAGYSKQFLGPHRSSRQHATVAHNEALEDAFLDAAHVFSPTELPGLRVAMLRKLAEFHASRKKYAEEATCRFHIHITLRQAARLHDSLWSSAPFLPWTRDSTDGVHLDGEGPAGEPEECYDTDFDNDELTADESGLTDTHSGKQIDKANSFRRIFYRVANSVRLRTGDWEIGGSKNLFYGVACAIEYTTVSPWSSLRELESDMVEEAEFSGDLYLEAGIAESSRYAWSLATQFYAEKFNYGKLAHCYRRLANVVSSRVPVVDTNNQALELSHTLGRFYRVWFHGGAPDELIGAEFVYRAAGSVKLEEFGMKLREVIRTILPENTPIDLVLDDGRPEESRQFKAPQRRPLGPTTIEPVKIKVTPLRPLLKRANRIRGTPEWFFIYTDNAFTEFTTHSQLSRRGRPVRKLSFAGQSDSGDSRSRYSTNSTPRHREHARSFSSSVFASNGSTSSGGAFSRAADFSGSTGLRPPDDIRDAEFASVGGGELVGVDNFTFLQPVKKDRNRASRDWLKSAGDIADKSLRVTQLQVEQSFPACVTRQAVLHRTVFTQSPLEAGVDAVCSWCSVLFRTAVATNGMAVLGGQTDQGIGTAAAKVVADCIHRSRVKDMGLILLKKTGYVAEEVDGGYGTMMVDYARLSEDEVNRLQVKLARGIVVFMEILHLLIARNRDLLLAVMEARKKGDSGSMIGRPFSKESGVATPDPSQYQRYSSAMNSFNDGVASSYEGSHRHADDVSGTVSHISVSSGYGNDRTDKAIAVQSELQRAFISMAKNLIKNLSIILQGETPRWLKQICQDAYFSSQLYRQTKIRMSDELFFFVAEHPNSGSSTTDKSEEHDAPISMIFDSGTGSTYHRSESPSESLNDGATSLSRGPGKRQPRSSHVSESSYMYI